jgi:hypothetical protein
MRDGTLLAAALRPALTPKLALTHHLLAPLQILRPKLKRWLESSNAGQLVNQELDSVGGEFLACI